MTRTVDGRDVGRSHRLLQACQQREGGVSGWFPPRGPSGSWTPPPAQRTGRRRPTTVGRTYAARPPSDARMPPGWAGRHTWFTCGGLHDDGVDEGLGVEGREVVGTLTETDELDGDAELALDRDDDAALGRAVELGQDDARDVDGLGEHLGLLEAVLAGGGV